MFETLTPMREVDRFRDEVDRLITGGAAQARMFAHRHGMRPAIDLYGTGAELILKAVVPGAGPDDLDVSIAPHAVTLQGRYGATLDESEARHVTWYRREIASAEFVEVIALPVAVEPDRVSATFADGILTLVLPKVAEARSRRVPITSETLPTT